jgi:exopolysaccharide production protein ExoZ
MGKLLTLQAARGVAANAVVLCHLSLSEHRFIADGVLPVFMVHGWAGVDLFFVLSGFLMVAVAGRNKPAQFLWRRAVRIYPTYWLATAMLLVFTILIQWRWQSPILIPSLWRSLLLVPSQDEPFLAVGWTLVHEVYFYLVFSVFLALRIPFLLGLIVWGCVLTAMFVLLPQQLLQFPVMQLVTNPITAEFIMGGLIAQWWRQFRMPGPRFALIAGVAALVFSICYVADATQMLTRPNPWVVRVVIFGIPCVLIIYALVALETRKPAPRPPAFLVTLGGWSYATYLTHIMVIMVLEIQLGRYGPVSGIAASAVITIIGLLTANFAGGLVHILFERPTLNRLQKLGWS